MRTNQSGASQKHQWRWSLVAVGTCMLIASQGSHLDYSYWKDELVSAAAIKGDWISLYRDWIIPDTAPPLYATLLKAWAAVWGERERTLRAMSLALTLLSLLVTARARLNSSTIKSVSTILFLGLSPTLIGHAQEARNYALTLFFSTCLIALYSKESAHNQDSKLNYRLKLSQSTAAILLSLSHYFGLLFAITATIINAAFKRDRRSIGLAGATIAAMMIWPIYHLAFASRADENLSRVEWIDVQPIIGTIQEFVAGVFPVIGINAALVIAVIGLASLANRRWRKTAKQLYTRIKTTQPGTIAECQMLISILLAFVVLLAGIDMVHPLSTSRNYIVALPAVAFLFGDIIEIFLSRPQPWIKATTAILFILITSSLLVQSIEDNRRFTHPLMNYKAVATVINDANACDQGCHATRTYERLKVYFQMSQLKDLSDARNQAPQIILGLGSSPTKFKKTINDFPELACWEPKQSVHHEVFLLVKDPHHLALKEKGFTPCKRV